MVKKRNVTRHLLSSYSHQHVRVSRYVKGKSFGMETKDQKYLSKFQDQLGAKKIIRATFTLGFV